VTRLHIFGQFSRTLSTLLHNGVPVLTALEITEQIITNSIIREAITRARQEVTDGKTLAQPLARSKVFPQLMVDLIKIGEETGDVPGALANLADTYESELQMALRVMTNMIEPVIICVMALGVGFLLISVLSALFAITSSISIQDERSDRNMPGRRGFTLIEIMMVVAIIGLTLTMGIPSFVRVLKKEGMRKAESELLEACQDARRAAIMNNQTTDLVLYPVDGGFEVPGSFERTTFPGDIMIDILGVNFIQLEKADQARVHFFPNGTSDEFTILIHSTSDGAYRKIYLDTVTALPVVEDVK
jgi:prepilin-type N-terminal cleavage/methylation domain-containing protein